MATVDNGTKPAGLARTAAAATLAILAGCASGDIVPTALRGAETAPAAPPPAPVAPPAPVRAPYVMADLIGMTERETEDIFGAPAVRRQEGLGVMRTYAFADCSLLLFLFEDTEGALTVQHADASARADGAARPDVDRCLATSSARKVISGRPESAAEPATP